MPPRRKKNSAPPKEVPTSTLEQMLIDAVAELPGERVLCTTLGRGQLAAVLAVARPEGHVVCHFLDLYPARLAAKHVEAAVRTTTQDEASTTESPDSLSLLCTAEIPNDEVDLVAFPTHAGSEAELTRDYLQCGHQALVEGGRMAVSTNNEGESWLHEQMQGMFSKVTRIDSKQGMVFVGRKTSPLKKVKDFSCEFAFRDQGNLIKAVSRPGVFSHRRLDPGARALLNVTQVRDGDKVLNMGCGSGAVALAVATRSANVSVTAIDSCARAIDCTQRGAELNELNNLTAIHTANGKMEGQGTFDLCLGNPSDCTDQRIGEQLLRTAKKMLKPGGEVLIAGKDTQWYEERMPKMFDGVGFATSGKYRIAGGVRREWRK
jgi:16S rRNA G1207 methylase RsmC